jgi:hypothetical protein
MAKKRKSRGGRKGLGQIKLKGMTKALLPPFLGSGLTMGTAFGIRAGVTPVPGTTSAVVYKWAPAIGIATGVIGAVALWALGEREGAAASMTTSIIVGGTLLGMERLNAGTPAAAMALAPGNGVQGLNAIVPQYGTQGLNAIVMEQLNGNQQGQGAVVDLAGVVTTGAFGTAPFGN